MKLKNSKLQDDLLLEEFYDKVVESYEYGENYYIILIHAVYDVPGKTKDGLEMEDASDTVYEHILCSICPVNLTKAGLTYNAQTNNIEDRIRDWFVEAPVKDSYSRPSRIVQPMYIMFFIIRRNRKSYSHIS